MLEVALTVLALNLTARGVLIKRAKQSKAFSLLHQGRVVIARRRNDSRLVSLLMPIAMMIRDELTRRPYILWRSSTPYWSLRNNDISPGIDMSPLMRDSLSTRVLLHAASLPSTIRSNEGLPSP
ncbi:hypothetical protein V2G26_004888 [Clonostachys chloroleuca]